ncbi:MAG: class I adenylate-forming enzyme family protein [Rubrivivax sp.]
MSPSPQDPTAQTADDLPPYRAVPDLVREHALARPRHPALVQGEHVIRYGELDALMDRVAASLQRDGVKPGDTIAICAHSAPHYGAVFLGALRAGVAVAPLAPSVTAEQFVSMLTDSQARLLFADGAAADLLGGNAPTTRCITLGDGVKGTPLDDWLVAEGTRPAKLALQPEWPFNIIYSSGTTGTPKGIVQSHGMRWTHVMRGQTYGYSADTVTLLSTPLYSNTTLVVFLPSLAYGGTVHLMAKFDAAGYLALAQKVRATHTMLVPVQYRRLMAQADFDKHDLRSFHMKFCTSAPFDAALKADVLRRWPGGLVEFYGMTEGGGSCILNAHEYPDKLHTVGTPVAGHDIRLIDEQGVEVPKGEAGEVVGHSPGMMIGYHGQPQKTREAEWYDDTGRRFIRTGDVGRFDADGFLILFDRRKDMVISGGFNIYPSDLEGVLREHAAVAEAAVVGVPSEQWGETPVAYVVRKPGDDTSAQALLQWFNQRVGKTQRLADLHCIEELPRSAIGKVLKRELRERHAAGPARNLP